VGPDLSVPGYPHIFCAGDLAAVANPDGSPVPAVAPAANQMGALVGANIRRVLDGTPTVPFRYWNKGDLATIGRHRAVARIAGRELTWFLAWLTWLFVHILYLVGIRNRVTVLVQWAFQYATFQRGVRLITGATVHRLLRASRAAHERRRAA
jgi:NADH dehydrogenase